jgi:hypothetical protein
MWALKAFANLARTTSLACIHGSVPGLHFQPQLLAKLDGSLVRQNGTSAERDVRPELVQGIHCNGSQFRSSVLHLLGYFGIWRAFVMLSEQ